MVSRRDHQIRYLSDQLQRQAIDIDIEAGWSCAVVELGSVGWANRRPSGDRRDAPPRTEESDDDGGLDYSDPTGDRALRSSRFHDDVIAMQDHRQMLEQSVDALAELTAKYAPTVATVPTCTTAGCTGPVESYRRTDGSTAFRQMQMTDTGTWGARAGKRPTCAKHRRRAA